MSRGGLSVVRPYSNKPLLYKRIGSGFRLYSIGPDFIDHGGDLKTRILFNYVPDIIK